MSTLDKQMLVTLSEAYAFLGNSLLKPMTQTLDVGLEPGFWRAFPDFESEDVREALLRCEMFASRMAEEYGRVKAVERVSVEYTKLFVGPPSPAAAPWETMQRAEGVTVGFGEPTFEMRARLRDAGLELSNENHQYEDHMGIELLLLSEYCRRAAVEEEVPDVREYLEAHPLGWIARLRESVEASYPEGYLAAILQLAHALMLWHAARA